MREIPELARAGIAYRPLVWTSEGRPHPAATRTLRYAAALAATRTGGMAEAAGLLRRWRHEIAVVLQQRRCAMVRAAALTLDSDGVSLLTGCSQDPGEAPQLPLAETCGLGDRAAECDAAWARRGSEGPPCW